MYFIQNKENSEGQNLLQIDAYFNSVLHIFVINNFHIYFFSVFIF